MRPSSPLLTFPATTSSFVVDHKEPEDWILTYIEEGMRGRRVSTVDEYRRTLRRFARWVNYERPLFSRHHHPKEEESQKREMVDVQRLTHALIVDYLETMKAEGKAVNTRKKELAILQSFCDFLLEHGVRIGGDGGVGGVGGVGTNPARHISLPMETFLEARELSAEQRTILKGLFLDERWHDPRGAAMFALGYYAGCRVSDVSHLTQEDILTLNGRVGRVRVGYKGGKYREIELANEARKYLLLWISSREYTWGYHTPDDGRMSSPYIFFSERSERLCVSAIGRWLKQRMQQAPTKQWEAVQDITFHDLRHDFAHRCVTAGWRLEEIALYLGHITSKGTPNPAVTARYTQPTKANIHTALERLS